MLRIWPALPIVLSGSPGCSNIDYEEEEEDGIVFALGQSDRVYEIDFDFPGTFYLLETVVDAMLVPFPALEHLALNLYDHNGPTPVIPDTFLGGGSAPHLQSLYLGGVSFPALPNLLLSARGIVDLTLTNIPRSGTFLPEAIVNHISVLPRLESLTLKFRSRRSCIVPRSRSPPAARAIFPALHRLYFEGTPEYLDDLISRIDSPRILVLVMTFFNQPFVTSDFCQLRQFIDRAENFKSLSKASITFSAREVSLLQESQTYARLSVEIICKPLHQQLWYIAQVANASLLPLSKAESLEFSRGEPHLRQQQPVEEDARWLNVLQPFSAVKDLYLHEDILSSLAYALKEVSEERISEVLPALEGLSMDKPGSGFLDKPQPPVVKEAIERFIAMRGLSTSRVPE